MARSMVVRRAAALTFALVGLAGAFIAGTGAAADATDGEAVIAGTSNTEMFRTELHNTGIADGLDAYTDDPAGNGVVGSGLNGVVGHSSGAGDGIEGLANNSCCSAVFGSNDGGGNGVAGRADTGTGVLAASTNGTALSVQGTLVAQRSGLATVSTNQIYKQVSLTKLSSATFIVATVQGAAGGVWVQRVLVNPAGGYFRIYLNKAATASTKVGWFAIN